MVSKILVLALTAAFCVSVHAQTSVSISGTATETHQHAFLVEVDHGSTPTAIDLTLDVTTPSAAGLRADMGDFDMILEQLPGAEVFTWVVGAGTVVLQLALPARTGVHQIYISFEPENPVDESQFAGTASVSAGAVTVVDNALYAHEFTGTRVKLGRLIEHYRETPASGVFWMDFVVDFGATAQSGWMAVVAVVFPGTQLRMLDMRSTPPAEIVALSASPPDVIWHDAWYDIGGYAGVVRFRLEFTKAVGDGYMTAVAVLPSHATLLSATDSLTPNPPSSVGFAGSNGGGGGGCVAGAAGHLGIAALLPALALARRRRRT